MNYQIKLIVFLFPLKLYKFTKKNNINNIILRIFTENTFFLKYFKFSWRIKMLQL